MKIGLVPLWAMTLAACAAQVPRTEFERPDAGAGLTNPVEGVRDAAGAGVADDGGRAAANDAESTAPPVSTQSPVDEAAAPPPPVPASSDAGKSFAGDYAGVIKFRRMLSVGSLGSINVLISIYATAQIADDPAGKSQNLSASPCHADCAGTGTGVLSQSTIQIPDVVMTTTHLDAVPFSVTGSGGSEAWSTPELHGPIGWKWTSPSDKIPTSATDSRVFDQDGDKSPGVTLNVLWQGMTTPISFVQTERDTLSGSVASNGDLVGKTMNATEQQVLTNIAGTAITSAADPNIADNTVRLVHVPAPLTCQQLIAQTGTLFP